MHRFAARLMVPALLVALAGCSSWTAAPPPENPNLFPADYKLQVLNTVQRVLDDPTNVRDAGITDPALRPAGKEERYSVCVRSNSRDVNTKEYQGIHYHIGWFYAGYLNQFVDATPEQCGRAVYKPFPELEKLCQAKSCA